MNMESNRGPEQGSQWGSTHWSIVMEAVDLTSPDAKLALESLCKSYWFPVYAYVRRRGHDADAAQDLTQEFFADLLSRHAIGHVDPQMGRFRSFLLTCVKNFLSNQWDKTRARKRGGQHLVLSIDGDHADRQYSHEPAHTLTAEKLYQREWSASLLNQVLHCLGEEYAQRGEQTQFASLRDFIAGASQRPYADVAKELGITESAAMTKVHRLRKKFAKVLRAEIARTLGSQDEIDDELREMIQCLG